MQADSQSSGSGSGSGSGGASAGSSDGGGRGGEGGAPGINAVYDREISPPDQSLADLYNANLAALGAQISPLDGSILPTGGVSTVIVPTRPTSINWQPWVILGTVGAGIYGVYYWWKHRRKG